MIVAGIMSGTSLDGIDVALVQIEEAQAGIRFTLRGSYSEPYAPEVRAAILGVSDCATHTGELARLHVLLGMLYADAVERALAQSDVGDHQLALIGCHGQTIYHQGSAAPYLGRPVACTLQIGEPSAMAERFGVPVVSDFRPRDMAAGGTGAPLVPYLDYLVFRDERISRIALNIGGIANLTAVPAGAGPEAVVAFDTGPGNMVMDSLMRRATNGAETFDANGTRARLGKPIQHIVDAELARPYYAMQPPKSAGREEYGDVFVERLQATGASLEDLLATAALLTARSIALGVNRFVAPRMIPGELLVSGGGRHNAYLMELLAQELPGLSIESTDRFHLPVDFKEAIAFAVLAHATWRGLPSNVPAATGARHPAVLGKITR
ncbi:MAG: anhydro-N-acetylmuramic acid kinase [Bryobacterales bacterium]|nr:anhydro-N-acetylmuramic acid kinase [Bryobacterales bacterium]